MDNTQVTHNNDNRHFKIAMDIAKEGSSLWDLTPYVKGRVGDNRFGLQVTWTYQGQLMNVEGMKPYIEGNVGQYSVDDKNNLQLDPNSGVVRYVGDPADCQAGGQATYYFPEQMFPKEGIFKGYIGLLDDRDDSKNPHISGVTVWFKVLPGIAEMGHACDYYISDLEKAEEIFKAKLRQHETDFQNETNKVISDARNSYTTEVSNAHDALLALVSQIQANRDEQANLTNRLAGTEQQIEIHDVVTRPEFLNLSNQLTQQVSQMKEAGLEFFNNTDDLKAKYPNGANKLCVTLNDSHEWVYDYTNGQWNDAGAFNYGTIDPKLTKAIYQQNPDNIIPNSQFVNTDQWTVGRVATEPDYYIENHQDGNALVMNGYVQEGSSNESYAIIQQIPIADSKYLTFSAEIAFHDIDYTNGNTVSIEFNFVLKDGSTQYYHRIIPSYLQDGKFHKIIESHITYPTNTVSVGLGIVFYGLGTVKIKHPQANFGYSLAPYSVKDLQEKINRTGSNLLASYPVTDWDDTFTNNCTITRNEDGSVILDSSNAADNEYNALTSPELIAVDSQRPLIVHALAQLFDGTGYLEILQYTQTDQYDEHNNIDRFFNKTNDWQAYEFNDIKLNSDTKFIAIRIVLTGKAKINVKNISVEYKDAVNLVIESKFKKDNFLFNFPSTSSKITGIAQLTNDDSNKFHGQPTLKLYTDQALQSYSFMENDLVPVRSNRVSLKVVAKANYDFTDGSKVLLEIDQLDASQSYNPDNNINIIFTSSSDWQTYTLEDFQLLPSTKYLRARLTIYNKASVNIADIEGKFIFSDEPAENLSENTVNLVQFTPADSAGNLKDLSVDTQNKILSIDTRNRNASYSNWTSPLIKVKPGSVIKNVINAKVGLLSGNQGTAYVEIKQFASGQLAIDYNKNLDNSFTDTDGKYNQFEFVNKLNEDTEQIQFCVGVYQNADLSVNSLKWSYQTDIDDNNAGYDLPQLQIDGSSQITTDWQKAHFKFVDGQRKVEGYLQYAMQGDSSKSYPKKNLKVKLFSDADCKNKLKFKPKATWQANNKFNIKANYIDATQSRNLVNAANFANAGRATALEHQSHTPLLKAQALGQMEGLPLELSFIDGYYGLMTLNTKKDDKSFGMDSQVDTNEAIEIEQSKDPFSDATATIDGTEFATDVHDQANDATKTNFSKMLSFISTSNDADFKAKLENYFDVKSIMNAMLWGLMSNMWDSYDKSIILLSWDNGLTWYFTLYDMDSTWDLYWNGSKLQGACDITTGTIPSIWQTNTLYKRVYTNFKDELQAQYNFLRKNVWRNDQLCRSYKQFIDSIPEAAYERDQAKWADIPSVKITDFGQIQSAIIQRGAAMDNFMAHLTDSTTDPTAK